MKFVILETLLISHTKAVFNVNLLMFISYNSFGNELFELNKILEADYNEAVRNLSIMFLVIAILAFRSCYSVYYQSRIKQQHRRWTIETDEVFDISKKKFKYVVINV